MQDEADTDLLEDPLPAPTTVNDRSLRPRRATSRTSSQGSGPAAVSASNSRSNSVQRAHAGLHESAALSSPSDAESSNNAITGNALELLESDSIALDEGQKAGERKRRRIDERGQGTSNASQSALAPSSSTAVKPDIIDGVDVILKKPRIGPDTDTGPDAHASNDATVELHNSDAGVHAVSHLLTSWNMSDFNTLQDEDGLLHNLSFTSLPQAGSSRWCEAGQSEPAGSKRYIDLDTVPDNLESILISAGPVEGTSGNRDVTAQSTTSSPSASSEHANVESASQPPEPLSAYTCPICFSPPAYATLTPCGHVCCGECLFTAIKATMQRAMYAVPLRERSIARCVPYYCIFAWKSCPISPFLMRSPGWILFSDLWCRSCPVCRAAIPGWDGKGGGVIGLKPRALFSL